jgi:hypothetical protein
LRPNRSHGAIEQRKAADMTVATHRISTVLPLALALGAITAPGAEARLDLNPPARAVHASQPAPVRAPHASEPPSVRVVRVAGSSGFDWGDAGIGAGGMAGLIAIGVGASLAGAGRRSRGGSPRPARVA